MNSLYHISPHFARRMQKYPKKGGFGGEVFEKERFSRDFFQIPEIIFKALLTKGKRCGIINKENHSKPRYSIMKYALRGITAEELTYTINRVKMERNTKFEIKPQFSRTIRRVQENDKLYFVALEVKVESTEEEPKPFNLKARLVGIFEAEDVVTEEDRQVLAISTTEIVYPYLRSAVSALTANAFINPLILPVIPAGTMFPEDRGEKQATLSFNNPDVLN